MDEITDMFWEVGPLLSKYLCKNGDSLESPTLTTKNGISWWLDFYPAGDDNNTDNLVFWLSRSNADKSIAVTFQIQFCFYTTPVRQYTLQHVFEKGEDVHKWVIDDLKNLEQLKIFIPPFSLCFTGYLRVHEVN